MSEQTLHKGLTPERWNRFPLERRLGMIASEFLRASRLAADDDGPAYVQPCYERARELLTWTLPVSPADNSLGRRLEIALRMIDETDWARWESKRVVAHSQALAELVTPAVVAVPGTEGTGRANRSR